MDNDPPIFLRPGPAEEGPYVFPLVQAEVNIATVVVQDPEGDDVVVVWEVPQVANPLTQVKVEGDGTWVSTLQLPRDPAFDGMEVVVTATDQSVRPNVPLVWLVEVP